MFSPEGGPPKGMSRRVFPNLSRTHKYGNLPFCKQLSFDFLASFPFCRKEIFLWERGNIWNWGTPRHNALGFFCWRRSLKILIQIKGSCLLRGEGLFLGLLLSYLAKKNHVTILLLFHLESYSNWYFIFFTYFLKEELIASSSPPLSFFYCSLGSASTLIK